MNTTGWITTLIGFIGGIGGIGTILYWRQNKGSATADAIDKLLNNIILQTDAFNKAIIAKDVMIKQLNQIIEEKTKLAVENQNKIDKLTREWQERDYEFATMKRQIKGMQTIIDNFEARAKYAENNICSVEGCELRVPALGTYKPK